MYARQGDYAKAEAVYTRLLELRTTLLGPDNPNIAAIESTLASVCFQKGELDAAEAHLQRALAINEKARGPEHTAVADELSNLVVVEIKRQNPAAAELYMRRALTIREKAYGPTHAQTQQTMLQLAAIRKTNGKEAKAEEPPASASIRARATAAQPESGPEKGRGGQALHIDFVEARAAQSSLLRSGMRPSARMRRTCARSRVSMAWASAISA